MYFNLATFQSLLQVVEVSAQEAGSVSAQWGSGDHAGAIVAAVQTAGAIAQSAAKDPQSQQEAATATSLATTLVPVFLSFASLFHKSAPAAPAKS